MDAGFYNGYFLLSSRCFLKWMEAALLHAGGNDWHQMHSGHTVSLLRRESKINNSNFLSSLSLTLCILLFVIISMVTLFLLFHCDSMSIAHCKMVLRCVVFSSQGCTRNKRCKGQLWITLLFLFPSLTLLLSLSLPRATSHPCKLH